MSPYYIDMNLIWDEAPAELWERFYRERVGAMQQSWRYGQALQSLGVRIHRAVALEGDKPVAIAQFTCRRLAGYLSLSSCARGPLWDPALPASDRSALYRRIQQTIPTAALRVTLFSPDQLAQELAPGETAGLKRVMTGYSTVLVDLRQPLGTLRAHFEGKWRNRLVKAESEQGLQVFVNASVSKCRWLLEREGQQRSTKNFHGLPTAFVQAWIDAASSPAEAFALSRVDYQGSTIAAMLFLIHGKGATYHIGWADESGRRLNAHNLLLWRGLGYLRERGIQMLDLGGVNTHSLPGISRFKLGAGGAVRTLAGTYF